MQQYKTINAFSRPASRFQIIAILVYCVQIFLFAFIIQKHYDQIKGRTALIVIYSTCVVGHLFATLLTSCKDPSDDLIMRCKKNSSQQIVFRLRVQNEMNGLQLYYCDLCRSYVKESSIHCRTCQRCTEGYDHHCKWINNCIGRKNYKVFLVMLVFTFFNMAIYLLSISLLSIERNFSKFLAEMIIVWISGVIALVFIVFILLLLGFHIYLGYHCMTTYNFVHKNKKRKITPSMSFLNIGSVAKNKVFPECYEPNGVKNSCQKQAELYQLQKHQQQQEYKQRDSQCADAEQKTEILNYNVKNGGTVHKKQLSEQSETKKQSRISQYITKSIGIMEQNNIVQPKRCSSIKNISFAIKPNGLTDDNINDNF